MRRREKKANELTEKFPLSAFVSPRATTTARSALIAILEIDDGPWTAYQYPINEPARPMRRNDGLRSARAKRAVAPSMVNSNDRW